MRQLMELKESDPAKFAAYAQMAVGAAKLAEEEPEAYKKLFQDVAAGQCLLSDRRMHPLSSRFTGET